MKFSKRYEDKFFIPESFGQTFDLLKQYNDIEIVESFPVRTVHSLYYDTEGMDLLRRGRSRNSPRKKYRIRWYGDCPTPTDTSHWEIKFNNSLFKAKSSILINQLQDSRFMNPSSDRLLTAKLHVVYKRQYFSVPNHNVRITIDQDISYSLPDGIPMPSPILGGNKVLMEIKRNFHENCLYFPLIKKSFSKYIEGCSLLYP